jgi:hypothetical protein
LEAVYQNSGKHSLEGQRFLKAASNYFPDLELRVRLNLEKYLDAISRNGGVGSATH